MSAPLIREIQKERKRLEEIKIQAQLVNDELIASSNRLRAFEDALKLIEKPNMSKSLELRPDSEMARVREILKVNQQPMHVDEIMEKLGHISRSKKASLVGAMNAYVKKNRVFKKVGQNTFTLLEIEISEDL